LLNEDVPPEQTWPNQHPELGKRISLDGIAVDKVLVQTLDYAKWALKSGRGISVPSSYTPQI
jgi:hypothetical protein